MQVGAVSSVSFKNDGMQESNLIDVDKAQNAIDVLRRFEDTFVKKPNADEAEEENKEPQKKNIVQIIASVAAVFAVTFALSKKAFRAVEKPVQSVINSDKFKNVSGFVKEKTSNIINGNGKLLGIKNKVSNVKDNLSNTKIANSAKEFYNKQVKKYDADKVNSKLRADIAGAVGATAGTIYISNSDSNKDGIADIAQKGVNAYKGVLEKSGIVAETINALS